ncbi:MAG: aminotransferase class I/II-fold pyridoxal phosphate-dependent enzyme [Hyphomonadaceae bacterium]|nr:aminotransferase class I/II-fold pyridoxal phosphate-dependent enzyme [Hyphomonadaceae bacterium]
MNRYASAPEAALQGSMRDFRTPKGANLLERVNAFYEWQNLRRENGLWPLGRSTEAGPRRACAARDDAGNRMEGVNFASQDYLSLSSHAAVAEAAQQAIRDYGVHSAGSPALVGNTTVSLALERKIGDFLHTDEVQLYPTGWAAGFGAIKGLVRNDDHIVMDALAHACLQEGASAATKNIHLFRHNDVEDVRAKLAKIRATDTENGILVVTEGLFSMDSDVPAIKALQDLAHEYNATLLVDVAHDLGNLGPDGRGHIGLQNMIGKVDVVMGSFSKTFASNGGFVAVNGRGVKEYLRFYSSPCTFSNAMSPVNAAIVLKAFEIIEQPEGRALRAKLMDNILNLRRQLGRNQLETYGEPSAIVCVKMGNEGLARLASRRLPELGLIANLVEFPAVAKGQARFRMQVMANHTPEDVALAARRLRAAHDAATAELAELATPQARAIA